MYEGSNLIISAWSDQTLVASCAAGPMALSTATSATWLCIRLPKTEHWAGTLETRRGTSPQVQFVLGHPDRDRLLQHIGWQKSKTAGFGRGTRG